VANDGDYTILAISADGLTIDVATASFTADTADNTAVFGPILDTGTPDTTINAAVNNDNAFTTYLRERDGDPNGRTFTQANLASAGETAIVNKVIKFPLGNAVDLKISTSDGDITTMDPWQKIEIKYFSGAYNREVDSGVNRDFGIVIDVGTHSGIDGSFSAAGTVLTTSEGGMAVNQYQNGTLRINEGTDENTSFTIASNTATTITISGGTFTATESNISFVAQLQTPIVATAEEIYEKVQWSLRQTTDIDATTGAVIGKTADALLSFVGDALTAGSVANPPANPNGGGTGVIIEGFDSNDTNRLTFIDNTNAPRTFPFVAAGTINFNPNLVSDTSGTYWMYFTNTAESTATTYGISAPSGNVATLDSSVVALDTGEFQLNLGDYIVLSGFVADVDNGLFQVSTAGAGGAGPWTAGITKVNGDTLVAEAAGASVTLELDPLDSPDAIIVDNNAGADITGAIGGASIGFDFDYDNNVQGGRTSATDAKVTIRAIGLETAQFIETTGTITRNTGLSFSLVSSLERNYSNP
jgi:hypothetical protein